MTSSSIRLSPSQQRVVDYRGGDLQVIACAGSGKTESISRRVAALVAGGAEPASIVAWDRCSWARSTLLRDSSRHPVDIAAQTTAGAVDSMARAVADIRRGRFDACPEAEKCGRCDFLRICCHRDVGAPIE